MHVGIIHWFQSLLYTTLDFPIPLDEVNRTQLLHFAVLVFERMWMERNKIRLGNSHMELITFAWKINLDNMIYWKAAQKRNAGRKKLQITPDWIPP